jgi:hypothetical protein
MKTCRFAAPWSIDELAEYFIVRDASGQALGISTMTMRSTRVR